jgi:hypothetical protein
MKTKILSLALLAAVIFAGCSTCKTGSTCASREPVVINKKLEPITVTINVNEAGVPVNTFLARIGTPAGIIPNGGWLLVTNGTAELKLYQIEGNADIGVASINQPSFSANTNFPNGLLQSVQMNLTLEKCPADQLKK